MKTLLMLIMFLPLFSMAQDKTVFLCQSPSHTFQIKQSSRTKQLVGTLTTASQKPQTLDCEVRNDGYYCKQHDYVAKVERGRTGRMIIQLELEGEFDVESGYLDTIYCR